MGYLNKDEHDLFVSYASSELNPWSTRMIHDLRELVATGLDLRQPHRVDFWMDDGLSGNEPLSEQLRSHAEKSASLLVLMTDWYLKSTWCKDERDWFVQHTRAGHPLFVVRVRPTKDHTWPDAFKDERGRPLIGYDFIGDDQALKVPRGHPTPENSPDSKSYYAALRKLATDIVKHMKTLRHVRRKRNTNRQHGPVLHTTRQAPIGLQEEEAAFLATSRRIFIMAGPRDKALEEEIRQLIEEFNISVFPVTLSSDVERDVNSIVDEQRFLNVLKNCRAIILLAGRVKQLSYLWLDQRILEIEEDISRKLGGVPRYTVIDAPPPPHLKSKSLSILAKSSPSFRDELRSWLDAAFDRNAELPSC
jgi:TIR domain